MNQPSLPLHRDPAPIRPAEAHTMADLEALDRACRTGWCREGDCSGCPLADTGDDWRETVRERGVGA